MTSPSPSLASNRSRILALCALLIAGGALAGCNDRVSDKDIVMVTLGESRAMLQDKPGTAKAVDVRPPADFAAAHVPGAINLDLADVSDVKDSIDPALDRYKFLIVYGTDAGSGSARAMTKRFMRAGHKGARFFAGGMAEWTAAGLKTEGTGAKPAPAPAPPKAH